MRARPPRPAPRARTTFGMFMSSMNTSRRLPMGGPYVSLVRFSTFVSKFLWMSREVVREEKLTVSTICGRKKSFEELVCSPRCRR